MDPSTLVAKTEDVMKHNENEAEILKICFKSIAFQVELKMNIPPYTKICT